MNLLADECCDAALVAALRSDGHDVLFAVESLRGATDDQVLERADNEGRILLTEDKDFGELVYRLKRPARGIVLLRFDVADRVLKIPRLRSLLENQSEQMLDAFVVIDKEKIRVRPLRR
jgi:predicted nuclease of predicted toxin-antitoxin system